MNSNAEAPAARPNWPRTYILSIYEAAIASGFVWITPISEAHATSLRMAFVRARRRSDKAGASSIREEFHLVNFGTWEPLADGSGLGRVSVVYNKLPDGVVLPDIVAGEAAAPDYPTYVPLDTGPNAPSAPFKLDISAIAPDEVTIEPEEIGSFVERMKRDALRRSHGDD